MPGNYNTVQSTSTASPFSPTIPFLTAGFGEAARLYGDGGRAPAGLDAYVRNLEGRIGDPNYQINLSQTRNVGRDIAMGDIGWKPTPTLQAFERGDYLSPDSNPWLQSYYDDAAGRLRGQIASQFSGQGRYGSGAMGDALGVGLSNLANQMYGGAYQQGQAQRLQASALLNQLQDTGAKTRLAAALAYPEMLTASDADFRSLAQAQQGQIDAPWQALGRYMGSLTGNYGGTTSTQQPVYSNPLGQGIGALGGLATAGYLGSQALKGLGFFGSNPASTTANLPAINLGGGGGDLFGIAGNDPFWGGGLGGDGFGNLGYLPETGYF